MELPKDLREFHVEIGKAILAQSFAVLGQAVPESLARMAPESHHVDAAMRWCRQHRPDLLEMAVMLERASLDDPMMSIISDLSKGNFAKVRRLRNWPYFAELLKLCTSQDNCKKLARILRRAVA